MPATNAMDSDAPPSRRGALVRLRWPLMIGAVLLVAVVGAIVYLTGGRYQGTDDAEVGGARVQISSSVSGRVISIDVREGQSVRSGQVLFQLDGRPFQTALADAQANLAQARLQVAGLKATYGQRQADLKAAQANLAYMAGEAVRQRALVSAGTSTGAQAAQAQNQAVQARDQVAVAQKQLQAAVDALGGNPDVSVEDHPTVQAAQARVATAQLNVGYIDIVAPQDGVATKVDQLQVGDYINAAQPVFSLVSPRFWIEAEFKENQLEYMRAGQFAEVKIDAYPHRRFRARVASISPGTGSAFSLLPAENATGNWVKVTQRVPVRLDFVEAPDVPLASGLSANVKVDTLHHRRLFGNGP
jgi:membrane fusion protein (multidrug efflux system)